MLFLSFSFLSDFLDIYVLVPRSDTFAALLIWKYILSTGLVTEQYIPAIDIFVSYPSWQCFHVRFHHVLYNLLNLQLFLGSVATIYPMT